jgi:uncharacterized protein YkwD
LTANRVLNLVNADFMKPFTFILFLFFFSFTGICQKPDRLNTAKNASYMKDPEKEMILEINLLRNDPKGYVRLLQEEYRKAKSTLEKSGKGSRNYSISSTYKTINGKEQPLKIDTVWNYQNEEEVKAIESLIEELNHLSPLSILQPDKGLYSAAVKHGNDQNRHHWNLGHRGSDGSWPWDRIRKFSPAMKDGNENLASKYPEPTPREIVLLLLIDSGIPGYGHRENLLNPKWKYVGCLSAGLHDGMFRWIQEFAE